MNDLDQKIQAALKSDVGGATPEEPNLAEEVLLAFRGRQRWLSGMLILANLAAFAGVVWSVIRFLNATDVSAQLQWGGLAGVLLMIMALLKLWFWLEMHTNRVLREVKRVELLLVSRPPPPEPHR